MSSDDLPSTHQMLDVRDVEGEPFGDIINALDDLQSDETLLLVNSFEPEPLYDVLERRGFTYASEQVAPDEWHVEIEQS